MQAFTSSPDLLTQQESSVVLSSPPPLATNEGPREKRLHNAAGSTPTREQLAELMGVRYTDKSRNIFLRSRVKNWVLKHIDMSMPFMAYKESDMSTIVKGCTRYMNQEFLAGNPWSKDTTHYVIHSIFEDTHRNTRSKLKSAEK